MNIIEESNKYVLNTYNRYPLVFDKGMGTWIYTVDNKKFLDMSTGIAVSSLGHSHPNIIKAIEEQANKLLHTSNLYYTQPYVTLAKKLVEKSVFDKVFFCNSGAEANEAAIKLTRRHGKKTGNNEKYEVITLKKSFHGRTMATLSATGQEKFHKGFEPLLVGFKFVELNNVGELKNSINEKTSAVIIEPIQGEGGIHPAFKEFIQAARELCDDNNAVLVFDEVQSGIGRTGQLFGYEHFLPVEPDVVTLAKGLGGGMPIGAVLVKEKYADLLGRGDHASTFGGNPVCCAAANAVLDTIDSENLLKNATDLGSYFRDKLNELKKEYSCIVDVRGMGLLNGIEINFEAKEMINKLADNLIIAVPAGNNVVRFLPPLNVKKDEIDIVIDTLKKIL